MDLSEQQKPRRGIEAMEKLRDQMRELIAMGKSRKQISLALGISPSRVTRILGAVRAYRRRA